MKTLVLSISICVSFIATAQNGVEQQFEAIWQKYRKAQDLPLANCNYKISKMVQVTPDKIIPIRFISNEGDTSYGNYVASGAVKFIPKFHDKNTSLLFTMSFNTKEWNGFVIPEKDLPKNWRSKKGLDPHTYMDSLNLQRLFNKIIESELYGGIMLTKRKFYVDLQYDIDESYQQITYTIKLYEVIDCSALKLPADYGYTFFPADNIDGLKPLMVDPKTKKLLYPELAKKQKDKK